VKGTIENYKRRIVNSGEMFGGVSLTTEQSHNYWDGCGEHREQNEQNDYGEVVNKKRTTPDDGAPEYLALVHTVATRV